MTDRYYSIDVAALAAGVAASTVRRWLADAGFVGDGDVPELPASVRVRAAAKYIEAYEIITGETFVPDESEPVARIRQNLARYIG